jgi:hypothetical protein
MLLVAYLALIIGKFLLVPENRTFYKERGIAVVRLAPFNWAAVQKGG